MQSVRCASQAMFPHRRGPMGLSYGAANSEPIEGCNFALEAKAVMLERVWAI